MEQRRPVTAGPRSLKTSYAILDGFLDFYFRFVEPYASRLRTRAAAERHLADGPAGAGRVRLQARLGDDLPADIHAVEREAVAPDIGGKVIATGSCKWTNAPLGYGEENLLQRLAEEQADRVTLLGPADLYG